MKLILAAIFVILFTVTIMGGISALLCFAAFKWEEKHPIENIYLDKFQNSDENLSLDDLKLTNNIKDLNNEQ